MGITDHFSAADVILDLGATNKRACCSSWRPRRLAGSGARRREILEALQARERLGSTALGRGVALPHARLEGDAPPLILFARLRRPIDFEARDEEPVDLVILVLWPEASPEGFLPALSDICRSLREPQVLRRLRSARTPEEVLCAAGRPAPGGA